LSEGQQPRQADFRQFLGSILGGDVSRFALAVLLDIFVVLVAYAAALLLRFDSSVPRVNADFTLRALPFIAAGYVGGNVLFGTYRTVWAFGSLGDIVALFRPVFLVTAVLFAGNLLLQDRNLPLSVILIAGVLIFPGMAVV
jgi:FlaA1/EpsC-like NDP-sugar epimerase